MHWEEESVFFLRIHRVGLPPHLLRAGDHGLLPCLCYHRPRCPPLPQLVEGREEDRESGDDTDLTINYERELSLSRGDRTCTTLSRPPLSPPFRVHQAWAFLDLSDPPPLLDSSAVPSLLLSLVERQRRARRVIAP
jgi:hypothetical protein